MLHFPQNLLIPFRRDRKRDFASGNGEALLISKVRQVLLTVGSTPRSSGEMPWRTNFGSGLETLRHLRNDIVLEELARLHIRDAMRLWLPEVKVNRIRVKRDSNQMHIELEVREQATQARLGVSL